MLYYFYNFDDDPLLDDIRFASTDPKPAKIVKINKDNFNIVNSYYGAKLIEKDTNVLIFLLVPRKFVTESKANACQDVKTLRSLLLNNKTNDASLESHMHRHSSNVCTKSISKQYINDESHLEKMMNRLFYFAKRFLPFGMLSILENSKLLFDDDSRHASNPNNRSNFSAIWSNVSTSVNDLHPAHLNEDAVLSALLVTFVPKEKKANRCLNYNLNMEIAIYFCYPTLGIAIALRPGDILFLQPIILSLR